MSTATTGINKRTVISESLEYTLTVSSYTSMKTKNVPVTRFYITKVYSTGREESVGFDKDEFCALVAAEFDVLVDSADSSIAHELDVQPGNPAKPPKE